VCGNGHRDRLLSHHALRRDHLGRRRVRRRRWSDTIYGIGAQANNAPKQKLVATPASAEQTQTQDITLTAAQPQVRRAITTFTTAVQSV
jgi:hypothetical protein